MDCADMTLWPGRVLVALGAVAALLFFVALFYRQPAIPTTSAQFNIGAFPAVAKREPAPGVTYAIDTIEVGGVQHPASDPAPLPATNAIIVHGWAVTPESLLPGQHLFVSLDSKRASPVTVYGIARPDVAAAINPDAQYSGFAAKIDTANLRPGPHNLRFTLDEGNGVSVALPTIVTFRLDQLPAKGPS
jgi:hypothetical protein